MNLRPLGNRLIVKRNEAAETSKGGLFIPEGSREKPIEGTVLAVGFGSYDDKGNRVPLTVVVGDVVIMGKNIGTEVRFDNELVVIIKEDELMGIVRKV